MAAAVEVPAGWTPPAYDKTDSEAAFLKETIETNRLMKNLEPSDREQARRARYPPSRHFLDLYGRDEQARCLLSLGGQDIAASAKQQRRLLHCARHGCLLPTLQRWPVARALRRASGDRISLDDVQ